MTVASTTNRKTYTGDNVSTSFATSPVIFYLTSNLQVRVTVIATGVSTLLTENTHYTVSGGAATGATGTVNLAGGSSPHGALLSTEKLVILRVLPLTQAVDLVNNNASDAEVLEAALDKLTDVDQQIQEQADRSIRFASGDVSGSVTEIPDVTTRAGRMLGFDATGLLTTIVMTAGTSLVDFATSAGASFIGWIQAGMGAVLRSVQNKLRDQVCVFDFMTTAQVADVQANTALVDVGAAITAALAFVKVLSSGFPAGASLYFPKGTYAYATCPNFAGVNGLRIYGDPGTVLKHTGTGNALLLDSGASPAFTNEIVVENIRIQGNANSTNGMYLQGIGRSLFSNVWVTGASPTGSALRIDFGLLNTWTNFQVNSCPGGMIPKYGIYLDRRQAGQETTTQTFINPIIEGLTTAGGAGIYVDHGNANAFIGGAIESNDIGVWITANSAGLNCFYGTDSEGNAVREFYLLGPANVFDNFLCLASGSALISGASANGNTFIGGRLGVATLDGTSGANTFNGTNFATSLTDTSAVSSFLNCSVAGTAKTELRNAALMSMGTTTATELWIKLNSVVRWRFDSTAAGIFYPNGDNTQDIGGAVNRIRDIYVGTSVKGGKIFPCTDAAVAQTASGLYAGTGVPSNANGNNGDIYFRSDGGAGTTMYQRRAGAWVATGA